MLTFVVTKNQIMVNTKEVFIGKYKIGGNNPILIQSMTNTNTLDIESTLNQLISLANSGCEIIRVTVPGHSEVEALKEIYHRFRNLGFTEPIVADVHFNPKVAEECAKFVEKVRINPGNYVDKKQFKIKKYSNQEYQEELDKINLKLKPLIEICKKHHTAIRIGVNHGSLSDRIVNKYGNTALGMAMSAYEFAKIFHQEGFNNIVFSLKSSDVKTMIYATRLFVKMMNDNFLNFPLHLGVTEAGEGEDGRIKSVIGIGTLLLNDIGNTIRVSLTESPENEIPVAKNIVQIVEELKKNNIDNKWISSNYHRRKSFKTNNFGGENPIEILNCELELNDNEFYIYDASHYSIENINNKAIIFDLGQISSYKNFREISQNSEIFNPIIIKKDYIESNINEYILKASIEFGSKIIEGLVDGISISNANFSDEFNRKLAENILQSCGVRHYKAEIVSCPSCGRTQYDIEKVLKDVKTAVSHLNHLKIGVMGCIVNGPGEMADADYGIVGAGKNKVWLYKGEKVVEKNIDQSNATETLIEFLKKENRWIEKI